MAQLFQLIVYVVQWAQGLSHFYFSFPFLMSQVMQTLQRVDVVVVVFVFSILISSVESLFLFIIRCYFYLIRHFVVVECSGIMKDNIYVGSVL